MVYGRTQMWHSWDPSAARSDHVFDLGVEPDRLYPPLRLLPQLLENRAQTPTTCNALIRRAAYEEAGGFEEAFPGLYEDQVFFAKLYVSSATYVSSRLWARYRRHDANETNALLLRSLLPRAACVSRVARGVPRRRKYRR